MNDESEKKQQSSAEEPGASASESSEREAEAGGPGAAETTSDPAKELAELKQRYQRLAADFHNFEKRSHRRIEQAGEMSKENMARSLLPVVDNFEHTLAQAGEVEELEAVLAGIRIVYDHMNSVLESQGITRIAIQPGDAFDPNLHQAILQEVSATAGANTVVRELAAGYRMHDHILRPAKVSIAKAPAAAGGGPAQGESQATPSEGATDEPDRAGESAEESEQ